jgi:non-specific protein-tyrosine kinase
MTVPIYSTSTIVRIATISGTDFYGLSYADRMMNTYVELATSTPVLDELKQQLMLSNVPPIEVKTIPNTELIQIMVEHNDPVQAANIANTLTNILINQSLELYTGSGKSSQEILSEQLSIMEEEVNQAWKNYVDLAAKNPDDTEAIQVANQKLYLKQQMYASILEQYEQARLKEAVRDKLISVVEPAIPPDKPSKPRTLLNIALGFIVSLVGGLGLAFLFENLDSTLFTSEEIEAVTALPTLGKIPQFQERNSIIGVNNDFATSEAFRSLRTNILSVDVLPRTLLITSAEPREGKSTIAGNLAYIFAQSGKKVIIVDADLRVPRQHFLFKTSNRIGLSNILMNTLTLDEAIQSCEFPGIQVLTSGPLPTNPSELLGSENMQKLIGQLSNMCDLVIIDAPAILAVTDSAVLASFVDAVVFVVHRAVTNKGAVWAAQAQLSKVKAKQIGIIINRSEKNRSHYYYNHTIKRRR